MVDRPRCVGCHSNKGAEARTYGACDPGDTCQGSGDRQCIEGFCRQQAAYYAPHFFEGSQGTFTWENSRHQEWGLYTMYNILANGYIDKDEPLNSPLLTKPLLEGFTPTQVLGNNVSITDTAGAGMGVSHGGSSKYNFGCGNDVSCPVEGVIDCSTDIGCTSGSGCSDSLECLDGHCRMPGSICDDTYVNTLRFIEYYLSCEEPN